MKIISDTNVLISATFWDGDSHKIISKVESKEVELILSEENVRKCWNTRKSRTRLKINNWK